MELKPKTKMLVLNKLLQLIIKKNIKQCELRWPQ